MKLNNDFDEQNNRITGVAVGLCLTAIVLVVFVLLVTNYDLIKRKLGTATSEVSQPVYVSKIPDKPTVSSSNLHVSDLDFYEMYQETDTILESSVSDSVDITSTEEVLTEANDGKHFEIVDYDGHHEWITINQYISKNQYDYTNLVKQGSILKYYDDNKCISSFGVDISKDQGYVDFNKLKKAGADFVIIRVGQRGYQSGTLSEDEYFKDSLKRATDAGLGVGVYFLSQAVNDEEASEEADYLIERIAGYDINYPVAFVMKYVSNDVSRVEGVSKANKTMIAKTFLKKIKEAGYKPLLYGDTAWLVRYIDLSKVINDYDIWLSDTESDVPGYPYKYAMWQYDKAGTIDGISGVVNFNLSYIDYSIK